MSTFLQNTGKGRRTLQPGQVYGVTELLGLLPDRDRTGKPLWLVKCLRCGDKFTVRNTNIYRGKHKCAWRQRHLDLVGKTFGRLTITRPADQPRMWYADCKCGTKDVLVNSDRVQNGARRSCGCLVKKNSGKQTRFNRAQVRAALQKTERQYIDGRWWISERLAAIRASASRPLVRSWRLEEKKLPLVTRTAGKFFPEEEVNREIARRERMATWPEVPGKIPVIVAARQLGVHPDTIRNRARRAGATLSHELCKGTGQTRWCAYVPETVLGLKSRAVPNGNTPTPQTTARLALAPASFGLTISKAAQISTINKGVISRAVSAGEITSNGLPGRALRLEDASFNAWLVERANDPERQESTVAVKRKFQF